MRIYTNFSDMINETKRDLSEMGIPVHPHTMQDKYVADNPEFSTKELQNYGYTVINGFLTLHQLSPSQPWADEEFKERINRSQVNPGKAWELRHEVWDEFLHDGKFAYTYSERLNDYKQLDTIINELKINPDSRQCYLSVWNPSDSQYIGSAQSRVPCSLGYLFQVRRKKLNMTYYMRSCDFITHFQNDVYLAVKLQLYVSEEVGIPCGDFTHFMNSLHIYQKDCKGVF